MYCRAMFHRCKKPSKLSLPSLRKPSMLPERGQRKSAGQWALGTMRKGQGSAGLFCSWRRTASQLLLAGLDNDVRHRHGNVVAPQRQLIGLSRENLLNDASRHLCNRGRGGMDGKCGGA